MSGSRKGGLRCGSARVVVVLGPLPAKSRKPLSRHDAKLLVKAKRRCYVGILIGVGLGLALLAMVLLSD
jgi:hypothetical protein